MKQLLPYIAPQQVQDVRDFGATCDGATDDSIPIQNALNVADSAGGGIVLLPVGESRVTTLELRSTVTLRGGGSNPNTGGATSLLGTSGYPVIALPESGGQIGFGVERLTISGGLNGLYAPSSASYHSYFRMRDVHIVSPSVACVNVESRIEEWTLDNVTLYGGQYGFRYDGARMDKCTFTDVETRDQALNGWNILTSEFSGTCVWIKPIMHTAGQHGFVAAVSGGATIRSWVFIAPYAEGNGQDGKNNRTTGTITAASPTLTVASATGLVNGDPIVVQGAGANGIDLFTTISSGGGTTTLTLAANASTSVTNAKVTNASFDDFSFASGCGDFRFIGGQIAEEGSGGHIRYAIDARGVTTKLEGSEVTQASSLPVYDPNRVANGFDSIRQPNNFTFHNMLHWMMAGPRLAGEMIRTLLVSPPGKNFVIGLRDSNDNTTGTFGNMEVRINDANKTDIFDVNGTVYTVRSRGRIVQQGTIGAALTFVDGDTTPSVQLGGVFKSANTGVTVITNFDDGVQPQTFKFICLDVNTTIANNATVKTNTGANKLLVVGKVYTFTMSGTVWYEDE